MAEFLMPILGADMETGTLVAWHRNPGDRVRRGDVVAEVETEKGLIGVEIFVSGVIERLLVEPGQKVPVGTVLAIVREEGVAAAAEHDPRAPEPGAAARRPVTPPGAPGTPSLAAAAPAADATARPPARPRVSPLARRVAEQLGIDPAALRGTGAGGAVTREDVERAAAGRGVPPPAVPQAAPGPPAPSPADRGAQLRQTIASAMARSKREIPHYYLGTTIDLGTATAWLTAENARRAVPDRLLPGVLLLKAVALALRQVPELNARWVGDRAEPVGAVHVGVAISLRAGGLVAPALHDTDARSLDDLMRDLRDLVRRARAGTLRSSELSDPTITVTSLGDQGVESVFGIVYPPQVAIVGFGRIVERPWVVEGQVIPRTVVTATLSADHRVTDGHRGGLFLAAVDRLLQEPSAL